MDLKALMAAMQGAVRRTKAVEIPRLGKTVYVRELTLAELAEQTASKTKGANDYTTVAATKLAYAICDESGNRLFDPSDPKHIQFLSAQPVGVLDKIYDAINALGEPEEEQKKD